ncbi:MAG TPA: DUF2490 domain-containing protein [Oligoflexia bacterium]|mgnify:CR=1 FL=1|nr:DUF2490 domain-containing protein [Oligoflexia bacterium]HMP49795.1 DUF2490 domain-containing protein [Oligoflexia bacterium]
MLISYRLRVAKKLLLFCVFFLIPCPVRAIPNDTQSWTLITGQINIDEAKKYSLYLEVQPRVGDNVEKIERLLLRPAIVYNLNQKLSFYLGYAWTPTFADINYDYEFNHENRIWQQIFFKHDLFGISWQHRFRQEQRYLEKVSSVSHRSRYLLRGSYALDQEGSFGLTAYNELFINLNDTGKARAQGYDRNRFFLGPYFKSGSVRYEVGYIAEHAKRFGPEQRLINAFLVSLGVIF